MPAQARRIAMPRAVRIGIATAVTGAAFALPLVTTVTAQAHEAPAMRPHAAEQHLDRRHQCRCHAGRCSCRC